MKEDPCRCYASEARDDWEDDSREKRFPMKLPHRFHDEELPSDREDRESRMFEAMERRLEHGDILHDEARDRLCVPDDPSPEEIAAEERWRKEDE
jgi:hypothetical protein